MSWNRKIDRRIARMKEQAIVDSHQWGPRRSGEPVIRVCQVCKCTLSEKTGNIYRNYLSGPTRLTCSEIVVSQVLES